VLLWDRPDSCFCCVLYALGQYQTKDLLLWDRSKSCFLLCFTRLGPISDQRVASAGSAEFMFAMGFYTHWGHTRVTKCYCGIAQIHVPYCLLRALGVARGHAFYCACMYYGTIRLTNCFCGIARIYTSYRVLHALGQYQINEVPLWDGLDSCFLCRLQALGQYQTN
jgi:hypothetical protein